MMSARSIRRWSVEAFSSPAAIAFLAAALTLTVGAWQIFRAHDAAFVEAEHDTRNLARSLAQHALRSLDTVDVVLKGAVDQVEAGALTNISRFQGFLARRTQSIGQVQSIAVLDDRGFRVATSSTADPAPLELSDRDYFSWHRDRPSDAFRFGNQITGRENGRTALPISRRWNKSDGSFGGVVVAFVSPSYFEQFYNELEIGAGGAVAIVEAQGRLLVRHPYLAKSADIDISGTPEFRPMFSGIRDGILQARSPIDGRRRIIGFARLEHYPLVMLASLAVDDTLAPWAREAWIEGSVLGAASLALVLLGLTLSRHRRQVRVAEVARRCSEIQLAQKSQLLEAMLVSIDQGLIVVSPADKVEVCNPRAMQMLDLPPALMESKPTSRAVLDHQVASGEFGGAEAITPVLKQSLGFDGVPHVYERRRPNGTVLEVRTVPMAAGGQVRTYADVTARRTAEADLRASEERYRRLAETTSDVITHLRLPDFERVYVSPSCRALFGCEPEEMLGQRPSVSNMHPDDASDVRATAECLASGAIDHAQVTYRARHIDGYWIWVEASLSLMRDERTDAPTAIVCSLRDVTERRQQAEELTEAKLAAEAGARAKSEFLATMSHEIRTPLNGVIGFSDLLADDASLTAIQRRHVERIQTAGSALLTIVNDILDYSKIESGEIQLHPRAFALEALIDNATSIVRATADRKMLALETQIDPTLPPALCGDEDRLRQVLLNLLSNAIKFTHAGSVRIAVDRLTTTSDGACLRFRVTDTGIGIPADKRDRLFERFSQVDGSIERRFGGTGLGLAISRQLVARMGGEIGVESEDGVGSTFWFTVVLPEAGMTVPETVASEGKADDGATHTGDTPVRILVVDDVHINRELAKALIATLGHAVDVVGDGPTAIAAVETGAYDLVLMDVQMPGMDGLVATRRIRALASTVRAVPIVAMTANVLPDQVAACRSAGMDDHVAKPFRRETLTAVITRWTSDAARGEPAPAPARAIA